MLKEAEKYKADDEANKARVDARNELESYAYTTKNMCSEMQDQDKKQAILEKLDDKIKWLDENQTASTEEYVSVLEELKAEVAPLLQSQVDPANMSGTDNASVPEDDDNRGPTIEEVD